MLNAARCTRSRNRQCLAVVARHGKHISQSSGAGEDRHDARHRVSRPSELGIGAGWFALEHDAFGIEFGTFTDRFEKLEEALQIVSPMLRGGKATVDGTWYATLDAMNEPPPVSKVPIMIGGAGEKKTLRMVAQYADESNLICDDAAIAHKLDVLAAHCAAVGRDRSEITISKQKNCCITPTQTRHARTCLRSSTAGLDVAKMSEDDLTARLGRSYGATRIKLESNSRRCLRPTMVSMASPSTCSPTGSLRAASSCSATLSLPCSADLLKDQASGLSSRVSRVPHPGTRPCTCCAAIID